MSAIMNFAIFPMDQGSHVGEYVSKVVEHIRNSGLQYQFSPMGTVVEADTVEELLSLIKDAYDILSPVSDRVYCNVSMDFSASKSNRIKAKRESIESRIGKVD